MGISNDNIHNPHTVNPGATYGQRGPPGPGFKLTSDGNYDIDNKKLTNVMTPTTDADAATKKYIDDHVTNVHQTGYLKKDGSVAMTGDLNVGGHKITNLATPTTQTGATTKKYVDDGLNSKVAQSQVMAGDAEVGKLVKYLPDKGIITPKLYVPDQYNDSVILEAEEQDYDDVHLKIPNLKNYDGREGRRKSSIVVDSLDNTLTGKLILPSGNLVIKDGNNQIVINRADINKIYGSQSGSNGIISEKVALYTSSGEILANTFGIKVGNNVIFLRSRNQSGWRSLMIPSLSSDATLILDQTNQTINGDKTFSKAITMSQEGSANNHLVTKGYVDGHSTNANYLKVDGSNMMTGDLNMNEQRVKNTLDPTDEQDTVNKRYLESQLNDYLKRNGQSSMTFDLNMNSYKIVNLEDPDNDGDATNKKYVKDEIAKIQSIDVNTSNFLKKDGSVAMTGNLNMATNKIKNLSTPTTNENDAAINVEFFKSELNTSNSNLSTQITNAYKKYVDESHVTPSGHLEENVFRYLMEDADESSSENNISVSGIVRFDASIHQNDKNAYRITLIKDLGSDNYRSRIGFNLGSLPIGYYTFVCEFFPIVMSNVSVTALGTTISINSQATKTFPTYAKTVVQFHRWNSTPPQFIYLDLHGSETSNARRILAHMVVYGVKGYFPNVPSYIFIYSTKYMW